jgi:uncharacterized membrane protein
MEQNRLKSYVLWVSVAALVGMALVDMNLIASTDVFDKYVDKLLYILILLGVVNNPSKKDKL